MSTDRDVTSIVRSWLEEGRTALPDRVLDAVFDQLPATPQRRLSWPARRFDQMSSTARLVGALAAVIVLAIVASALMFRTGGVAGPARSAPLESAAASVSPVALMSGAAPGTDLQPGTYLIAQPFPVRATLTVPAGWTPYTVDSRTAGILVNHGKPANGSGWGLFLLAGPHLYRNPCRPADGPVAPTAFTTTASVVASLSALPAVDARTSETTVAGRPATLVTLTAHADTGSCADGGATLWQTTDGTDYVASPGQVVQLRVVDVDGTPVVILTSDFPESSKWENEQPGATPNPTAHTADQAELHAILGSVTLDPAVPTSAAASPAG